MPEIYFQWTILKNVSICHISHRELFILTDLGYLTSEGQGSMSFLSSDRADSFGGEGKSRNTSSFKTMAVQRGFTEEADKLLDYLVRR